MFIQKAPLAAEPRVSFILIHSVLVAVVIPMCVAGNPDVRGQSRQCLPVNDRPNQPAAQHLSSIADRMTQLADSARKVYSEAAGFSEGLGYEFYAGAATVQRAAVTLDPLDLALRFKSGELSWRSAIIAEGEIDTLLAKGAREDLVCARDLAKRQGNDSMGLKVDTLILAIDSFLEDQRLRR